MRERGLLFSCARTYNGVSVLAAKEKTGSLAMSLPQAKTRVWGAPGFPPHGIGASSALSPISRPGCRHVYDETASGRLVYPNGLQSQFTYDDLNRLTALNNGKASYTYTLDGTVGNRKQVTESSGRTVNWSYDNIYRLTNETITLDPHSNNGAVSYGLDPVGNRLSQQSTLSAIASIASQSYDQNDRLSTETYDANGNTLVTGARTFTYDFDNRLKTMSNSQTSATATIVYDADGNRVAKTVNGVTTRYLVDDLNPTGYAQVVEEAIGGAVTRSYTYGLQRINQNQLVSSTWTPSFYGYDGMGSVRTLTDVAGTITDTYDYDAWGKEVNFTGSTSQAYLYRGEEYDPDLNVYHLRARYFDQQAGRFLTRDPADGRVTDPQTLHRYLYAASNPINRMDPSGRAVTTERQTLIATFAFNLALAQVLVQADKNLNCIWQKADDELEIAFLNLVLSLFPDAGGPDDPGVRLAGARGNVPQPPQYPNGRPGYPPNMFPEDTKQCRQYKCVIRCYVTVSKADAGQPGSPPAGDHGPFQAFLGTDWNSCDAACKKAETSSRAWLKELLGFDPLGHCNPKGGTRRCWQ